MRCKVKVSQKLLWQEQTNLSRVLCFILVSLISYTQSAPPSSTKDEVVFYEDPKYDGNKLFLTLGKGCYTMERDWDDRISSVDPQGNCLLAYEKTDCRGRSVKISEGSTGLSDLGRLEFDNVITSISVCTRANGGLSSSSSERGQSDMDEPEIRRVGVEEHNRYRSLHGVPPLKGDRQLHDDAQEHADYLAKNNRFEVSPGTKYGENLATSYKKDKTDALREVIKRWYDKIEYFNFRNPESNRDRPKSAQFSSIVWKSTTHVGIGVARNNHDNKWVIVVFYDPAATRTKYRENVPPAVKEVHTEEPGLFRTSPLSNFYNPRRRYEYFE